jgi:hypothetical protein
MMPYIKKRIHTVKHNSCQINDLQTQGGGVSPTNLPNDILQSGLFLMAVNDFLHILTPLSAKTWPDVWPCQTAGFCFKLWRIQKDVKSVFRNFLIYQALIMQGDFM